MVPRNLLEDFTAQLNANVFLREFAFSSTDLRLPGIGEIEIADHLILLDDLGFAFQLKERDSNAGGSRSELAAWFQSKVLKKAVSQVRDTLQMLRDHAGSFLTNDRGHRVQLPAALPRRFANVVLYRAPALPEGVAVRFYRSKIAGFIHVLPDVDYLGICQYFVTPVEVLDYFDFREQVLTAYPVEAVEVTEAALVGQYLLDEQSSIPGQHYLRGLEAFREDRDAWDVSYLTENFGDRVTYQEGGTSEQEYYRAIAELAKLSRSELRAFKERFKLALEAVRADRYVKPYRFACPRTDCGFLILPLTTELSSTARATLHAFSLASKHELGVFRQIGLAIWKTGDTIDIEWLLAEWVNQPNPELDAMLAREDNPFRPVRAQMAPRYWFDTDTLDK